MDYYDGNLTREEYRLLQRRLSPIVMQLYSFVEKVGGCFSDKSDYFLPILVNVSWLRDSFHGNFYIGPVDDREEGSPLFMCSVLKAEDRGKRRYVKRHYLFEKVRIDSIERAMPDLADQALDLWSSWRREDLTWIVELKYWPADA